MVVPVAPALAVMHHEQAVGNGPESVAGHGVIAFKSATRNHIKTSAPLVRVPVNTSAS